MSDEWQKTAAGATPRDNKDFIIMLSAQTCKRYACIYFDTASIAPLSEAIVKHTKYLS